MLADRTEVWESHVPVSMPHLETHPYALPVGLVWEVGDTNVYHELLAQNWLDTILHTRKR